MPTFNAPARLLNPQGYNAYPAFADIDGDGDLDILFGQSGTGLPTGPFGGIISLLENTGTNTAPTFTTPPVHQAFNLILPESAIPAVTGPAGQTQPKPGSPTALTRSDAWTGGPAGPTQNISAQKPYPETARPTFVDIDGDGDLDAFMGEQEGSTFFYRNVGNPNSPTFEPPVVDPFGINRVVSSNPAPPTAPFTQTAFNATPRFVDIDGDGDLDAFVARFDQFGSTDGNIEFYRNEGTPQNPQFLKQTGAANPFEGVVIAAGKNVIPAFADVNGDGLIDAVLGVSDTQGELRYFENRGTPNAPQFVELTGADNPFNALNQNAAALEGVSPVFADLNGNGKPDLFYGLRTPGAGVQFLENTTQPPVPPVPPPPPPPPVPPVPPVPPPPPPGPVGDLLSVNANNVFTVGRNNGNTNLQYVLSQANIGQIDEIGIFKVDSDAGNIGNLTPGSAGYVQAALSRAQAFFSVLPNGVRPAGFSAERQQGILDGLQAGDRFVFYSIKNATSDAVVSGRAAVSNVAIALADRSVLRPSDRGNGQFTLGFEQGNDGSFNDITLNLQQTGSPQPLGTGNLQQQGQEFIDLIDAHNPQVNLSGRQVQANLTLHREALFNNAVGLYRIDDAQGTINGLAPGQEGYARAAIERRVAGTTLTVGNQQVRTATAVLDGDALYAPFLIANATPEEFLAFNPTNRSTILASVGLGPAQAYFPFLGANPDRTDHILLLGNNTFGFEDLPNGGDRDYNDLIFRVDIVA